LSNRWAFPVLKKTKLCSRTCKACPKLVCLDNKF
jgi:hypothetical protein